MFDSTLENSSHITSSWFYGKSALIFLDSFPSKISLPLTVKQLFRFGFVASVNTEIIQGISFDDLEAVFFYEDSYPVLLHEKDVDGNFLTLLTKLKAKENKHGKMVFIFEVIHYDQKFVDLLTKYSDKTPYTDY